MRFSRERVLHLAARLTDLLAATDGVVLVRPADDVRAELARSLGEEVRVEESIDLEVRRILASYARPAPEGSPEWEVLYQKTREEVYRRRFRVR